MIHFTNVFLSYVVVLLVIVVVAGAAVTIGIHMRKKKNTAEEALGETVQNIDGESK